MSTQHTPGEWTVPHFANGNNACSCAYVFAPGYHGSICEVSIDNGIESICEGGNDCPPLEEAKANARLIAAAPVLLAACINALDQLKDVDEHYPCQRSITELRRTIAKATQPTHAGVTVAQV